MKTPILGSSYVIRSVNAADNRMVNLYPEVIPEGGKEPAYLQRCPGLSFKATVGTGPIRGLYTLNQYAYVVSGSEFYRVDSSYTATKLGDVTGTGPVSIADNGIQLFLACNPDAFIYNTTTSVFAQVTDPDFPGAVTVGYLDGYFVFNEPNSQRVWITALFDGTSIDALDFASAEAAPDNLVALIVDHREAWLFGTNSTEVWYNSGDPDFPLTRIQGAYNEIGCVAPYSVAKMDNSVFWLGADARGQGIVYRAQGYQAVRISTHAIEFAIQQYDNMSDALAYTYQQDGHTFYVLIFPSADTTWVYDAATGAWHERAGFKLGEFTRHRSNCHTAFNGESIVGDYENGNLYAFDLAIYADNGLTQKWLRRWRALPTGANNLKRTVQHTLQLDCETGVGLQGIDPFDVRYLTTQTSVRIRTEQTPPPVVIVPGPPWGVLSSLGVTYTVTNPILSSAGTPYTVANPVLNSQGIGYIVGALDGTGFDIVLDETYTVGANPRVMLRWSDDGGHTWNGERVTSMGRIGQYGHRAIWRRLGMTTKLRDRVYEVSGTDPVKIAIMGAELQLSGTNA